MKKFWNQSIEIKSLIISLIVTVLGFGGTAVLFWLQRYDIPLAVLLGGLIVSISWLLLYLSRKREKPIVKIDIILIYARLTAVVVLAIIFTILEMAFSVVTVSPVFLVVSYLVVSLSTLLAYLKKGENDV